MSLHILIIYNIILILKNRSTRSVRVTQVGRVALNTLNLYN